MRKIIVSEFVTVDGIMEGPGPVDSFEFAGWTMKYSNEDIMKYKYDELYHCDALLLGKTTYEGFASVWPTMEGTGKFGERMNSVKKYVVSNSLKEAMWENTSIISGEIVSQLEALKQTEGKDILVFGSSLLVTTLIKHNLVDEYTLLVYPVVLGAGKRLFKEGCETNFTLLESKTYDTGVILTRYSVDK